MYRHCVVERIVDIAHEGHLGIVKTKALPREKVWFPCMDKIEETKVKACLLCQVVTPACIREPRQMSVLPDSPFDEVSVDFAHMVVRPYYWLMTTQDFRSLNQSHLRLLVLSVRSWISCYPHLELPVSSNLIMVHSLMEKMCTWF